MDFDLLPDDHPVRATVRRWLAAHPDPSGRALAEAGFVAPHWPEPWGLGADPLESIAIEEELCRVGITRHLNPIGTGWAGPTVLHAGTEAQKDRYLFPLLAQEETWCQLFSEPGAGSDLASLTTRAVRDGDAFVVTGQKIWTSHAHTADFGILLARTDPEAPKYQGISYLICPMGAEGIEIRPIVDITGSHTFNEVFLDEVRIPVENLVGEEHGGWSLAQVTLGNERVSLSTGGALWGDGPMASDLFDEVRASGRVVDPVLRQSLAALYIEAEILRLIRLRSVTEQVAGSPPGPVTSIRKVLADEHGQRIMELAKHRLGASGMLAPSEGPWHHGFLFAPALTVGGGTSEIQRNIVAERLLGLPRDAPATG